MLKINKIFNINDRQPAHEIKKWNVVCFPMGMIEIIVANPKSHLLKYMDEVSKGTGIDTNVLIHHIAISAENFDQTVNLAKTFGKIVGEEIGYTGKRIAFLHPSALGILIEIMEV